MKKNNNLKNAFKYAKKQKKAFILYFVANIALAIIGAIAPLLSAKELLVLTDGFLKDLLFISILVLCVELSRNICHALARKYSQIFAREVLKDIQIDMANEVLKIETADLDKKSSGVFIDRLVKDTSRISDIFLQLNMSITDVITNIGILVAIFVINKYIFLYYLVGIVLIFILEKMRVKKYNLMDKEYRRHAEKTTGLASELIRGIRDIKVLNASESFMNTASEKITDLNFERYKMSEVMRKYSLLTGSVRDTLDFILILISIFMISHGMITIPSVVIIYMYRTRVFNLLTLASQMMEWYKDFNLSASRVFEIIDSDVFKKEKFGTKHIDNIKGDFEFKNVSFSYDGEKQVLDHLSFKIKHNETVSFVGKSGAGKTTIFNLLAKMYDIDDGEILIDGINIKELDKDSIRGNISIITQNPYIFNMTIKDNLKIVKEGLTDEEIVSACKTAMLDEFILSLPDKYDTLVGEGGLSLSGGQRQRLAIARALVQKTKIILFDEATSALDNETQKGIQDAINNMKDDYTILIIAHRLSTVINSDKIMIVSDGKITASGTHEELLKKNKEYKRLYDMELKKNQN